MSKKKHYFKQAVYIKLGSNKLQTRRIACSKRYQYKMRYPHTEKIRIAMKGKSDLVQKDGLNYLIPKWKVFVNDYANSEDLIYEWLNDLDGRKIIDEILNLLPVKDKEWIKNDLEALDKIFREKTFEINECVWGENVERDNSYDRDKNWYYYRMNQMVFDSEPGQFSKKE